MRAAKTQNDNGAMPFARREALRAVCRKRTTFERVRRFAESGGADLEWPSTQQRGCRKSPITKPHAGADTGLKWLLLGVVPVSGGAGRRGWQRKVAVRAD